MGKLRTNRRSKPWIAHFRHGPARDDLPALGVAPDYAAEIEQRPFYVTKDGLGKPVL